MKISLEPRRLSLIVILVLAILPYFINLGSSSLWDSNEAFYAETPREMIESGDYVNPTFNYQPRFNKPPLVYWVVALFYKAFDISEAVERLPIALAALVLIATALCLGRVAFSTDAGLIAAIALATTPRFLMFSRRIAIDLFLAMFMSLAVLMFLMSQRSRRRVCLVAMYVAIALGVLTKGPVAILLPGAAILIYLAIERRLGLLRELMLGPGLLIVILIVTPWYAAVYSEHGWHYIKTFLLADNISRYTQPVWGPRRSLFFYLPVLAGDLLPWSLFLPMAIWYAIRSIQRSKPPAGQSSGRLETPPGGLSGSGSSRPAPNVEHRPALLLLVWIGVVVLFFSFSRNKEDLYVLPVYPAAAALVGGSLARWFRKGERRASRIPMVIGGIFLAGVGAGLLYALYGLSPIYELAGGEAIAYLAVAGGLIATAVLLLDRGRLAVTIIAFTFVGINWVFVVRTLPDFEKYKPVRALCEVIRGEAQPVARVGYYRTASPSMVFYLRRQIFEYYQPEQLQELFSMGEEVYCVMAEQDYEAVKDTIASPTIVLARRPTFQVKFKTILDGKKTPQVLLITNKLGAKTPE
jgi:4-amino-4-deoxy-L-arabinose transferase-like glycosyltransferase